MKPMQYAVYKGTGGKFGAIQFNPQPPHFYQGKNKDLTGEQALDGFRLNEGWKAREGCVFVEITSAKGPNIYDWENKIIMALSVNDMGKVLLGLSKLGEMSLMHDPGAKSESAGKVKKFLNIKVTDKGAMFRISMQGGSESKNHIVPLTPDEVVILRVLLTQAISKSLNW